MLWKNNPNICFDTIYIYEKDMRNSILILSGIQHIEFNKCLIVLCYIFDICRKDFTDFIIYIKSYTDSNFDTLFMIYSIFDFICFVFFHMFHIFICCGPHNLTSFIIFNF